MIIKNAKYLDDNFDVKTGDIEISDGIIKTVSDSIEYDSREMVIDCEGFTVVPGFIDIHTHGAAGFDSSDGDTDTILEIANFLISNGVTTFCPTTMSMPLEDIRKSIVSISDAKKKQDSGSFIAGINLEGPFISVARKGAQDGKAIINPNFEIFKELYDLSGGIIKLVDIAPEQDGGMEFIAKASKLARVSIAHTTTDFDGAKKAFEAGITHATHLYNAMSGISHREPGVTGAVIDTDTVFAELVCDGHHIHPAVVRATFKLIADRLVIISDSMRLCGLPEGEAGALGGQTVTVQGGKATLSNGTIAGSVTNLHTELKNLVSWGIPFPAAVKAMTINPARAIGMDDVIGSIKEGKKADLVVLDENLNIVAVYH